MRFTAMPGCCGALVLSGFGYGEHFHNTENELVLNNKGESVLYKDGQKWLETEIRSMKAAGHYGLITAVTTQTQVAAEKMLRGVGFHFVRKPVVKRGNRKMKIWYLDVSEFGK